MVNPIDRLQDEQKDRKGDGSGCHIADGHPYRIEAPEKVYQQSADASAANEEATNSAPLFVAETHAGHGHTRDKEHDRQPDRHGISGLIEEDLRPSSDLRCRTIRSLQIRRFDGYLQDKFILGHRPQAGAVGLSLISRSWTLNENDRPMKERCTPNKAYAHFPTRLSCSYLLSGKVAST